ncbi:carbamoyltransferase C-terminal domain-containing protein [Amycolatopsis regifaucium]|uniref:Carbamoyltransferase n=1 Tax=Amycolatopsis regifaucium TaxID=546365 RepID=A0A154M3V0_9PSEU|nr:carbamoyltransferase C-terminal domain-containing protein [Amycolatopsis regifaucium]KZB79294.1 hypothetical protein AVL48_17020 [Amycolatopsis regifaucium]OKA07476.1 hypothetical protein ATP06_0216705 [Amycolatopsis regifaucium]SFH10643.1 carbamoyltransferase [Amycolatopsis regifaucium]
MWVLGINWEWHDTAAALVDGEGRIHAFAEEERFTRVKHAWDSFPARAAAHCLRTAGIGFRDVDVVAVGWDIPHSNLWHFPGRDRRRLLSALFGALAEELTTPHRPEIVFVEHHVAHALSSFHASGFERAGVLVVDGSGEFYGTTVYAADRMTGLRPLRHWHRGFSLGALYEATTRALGLGILDAGKTMGLAAYETTDGVDPLPLGDLVEEGPSFFGLHPRTKYQTIVDAWGSYLGERFGTVTSTADDLARDPVAVRMAASAQRTVELALPALHAETRRLTGFPHVCLAGGVALNSVANGRLPEPVYIPPFPHDAGVALGAAWSVRPPVMTGLLESPYLGTAIGEEHPDFGDLVVTPFTPDTVVEMLLDGRIGAVAEGRAEVGPRALGHRSIIALPSAPSMRDRLNTVKRRERWRPFAPVTLHGYAPRLWPGQGLRDLYMIGNAVVSEHGLEVMPAAVHVDGTTRPQILPDGSASVVRSLLETLRRAGVPPVLVNTSFNGPGEPIVNTAVDALRAFRELGLDFLILGDRVIRDR